MKAFFVFVKLFFNVCNKAAVDCSCLGGCCKLFSCENPGVFCELKKITWPSFSIPPGTWASRYGCVALCLIWKNDSRIFCTRITRVLVAALHRWVQYCLPLCWQTGSNMANSMHIIHVMNTHWLWRSCGRRLFISIMSGSWGENTQTNKQYWSAYRWRHRHAKYYSTDSHIHSFLHNIFIMTDVNLVS